MPRRADATFQRWISIRRRTLAAFLREAGQIERAADAQQKLDILLRQ
jgi:hypothetical protein